VTAYQIGGVMQVSVKNVTVMALELLDQLVQMDNVFAILDTLVFLAMNAVTCIMLILDLAQSVIVIPWVVLPQVVMILQVNVLAKKDMLAPSVTLVQLTFMNLPLMFAQFVLMDGLLMMEHASRCQE